MSDIWVEMARLQRIIDSRDRVTVVRLSRDLVEQLSPRDKDGNPIPLPGEAHIFGVPAEVDDGLPAATWEVVWSNRPAWELARPK